MLKHLVRGLVVGWVCTVAVACNGDDDDDTAPAEGAAAPQCRTFISTYCNAVIDCVIAGETGMVAADQRDVAVDACISGANENVDCSRAVGVSDSYDECIAAFDNLDCDAVNDALASNGATSPLPAACMQVIQIL